MLFVIIILGNCSTFLSKSLSNSLQEEVTIISLIFIPSLMLQYMCIYNWYN